MSPCGTSAAPTQATKPDPVEAKPKPATFGTIVVAAVPWAKVFVDNKPAQCSGKSTSNTPCELSLTTGWNSVVLRTEDQSEKKLRLKINKGKNTTECWNFKSDSKCNR